MKFTEFREELQKAMNRVYSDNAARDIRRRILESGWNASEISEALSLIKEQNNSGGRVILIPVKKAQETDEKLMKKYEGMKAIDFINDVNEFLGVFAPKDRLNPNGKLYPSTQWYRWFNQCFLSLEINVVYEPEDYLKVLTRVKKWANKKGEKVGK